MTDAALTVPPVIVGNPVLSAFWIYWHRKRGARVAPSRSDIDPTEISQLLPHIQLIDKVEERFRYRLCGTAIVEAYGRELTGKFLDEVIPDHRREIAEQHFEMVYKFCRPIFVRHKYTTTKSVDIVSSRAIAPLLSDDGAKVAMLGVAQTFAYGSRIAVPLGADAVLDPYRGEVEFI